MNIEKLNDLLKDVSISSGSSDGDKKSKERSKNYTDALDNDKKKKKLKEIVKSFEILFNWQPYLIGLKEKYLMKRFQEKGEEIFENREFKHRSFIFQLCVAYEIFNDPEQTNVAGKSCKEALPSPLVKISELETILSDLKKKNCKEPLFIAVYEPLLRHIILGSKAFMMIEYGLISEAEKVINDVLLVSDMTLKQTAALYGIKASILIEYGSDYFQIGLDCALKARELDSSIAEWHFIVGKIMARIRHVEFTSVYPETEEINALEKAVQLCSTDFGYKIHLAQSYQEKASAIYFKHQPNIRHDYQKSKEVNLLNEKCYDIYRELLSYDLKDSQILARCAFKLAKLPWPLRDIPVAVDAIEKAIALSPENPLALHYAGIIYDRYANNETKAKSYYRKAAEFGVYGAAMDLVRLKYKEGLSFTSGSSYSPLADFKKMEKDFTEKEHYFQTMANIAAYYFFIENDTLEAWNYLKKIFDSEPNHPSIRKLKAVVVWTKDVFDFCEVMIDDINGKISNKEYKSEEEEKKLMEIKDILLTTLPSSCKKMSTDLKKKILNESRQEYKSRASRQQKSNRPTRKNFNNKFFIQSQNISG